MADHRHKHRREREPRLKPRAITVAAPFALLATTSAVTVGVVAADPGPDVPVAEKAPAPAQEGLARAAASIQDVAPKSAPLTAAEGSKSRARLGQPRVVSRSAPREGKRLWTTADLNLWTAPGKDARLAGEVDQGERILVTGRELKQRVEVVIDGQVRWVSDGYLAAEKPAETGPDAPLTMEPCADSSPENGLTDAAVRVYRAVCHAFPQITTYGGWDNHGEHSSGKAIDIMTSDVELGTAIADFLQKHAGELDLYDILWRQRIWTPVRSSEGWRQMPSRGSATANHFDHVHVATNS